MMHFTLCADGKATAGGRELLDAWRAQPDAWLWVDLQDEAAISERHFLVDELGLDEHAVTEAQRPRHPPGFEAYPGYLYLLSKPLTSESEDLEFATLQLALFAGPRLLVTRHSQYSRFIASMRQRFAEQGCADESPLTVTAAVARRISERYGKILLDLERRLDEIEDQLFDSKTDRLMQELVGYNTALRKMRRILAYHTNAFRSLRDSFDHTSSAHWHEEFDDIHSLMERFHSLAELYQNVITDLIEGYISLNAHHLNQIMKVLTIVTVIFVPLTLLVGIYGMNFEYIPELKSQYGYFILLGVMSAIVLGLLYLFRRVRWL
ncbi:MAG: magnesium transporter CorA family protein [Chromatiaceae bacterium]|nr:magnesium transporter CorA family protein [Chromatiaceae bacterium]